MTYSINNTTTIKRNWLDLYGSVDKTTPALVQCSSSSSSTISLSSYSRGELDDECQNHYFQPSSKRIRLAPSPAESRLQQDLCHLVSNLGWNREQSTTTRCTTTRWVYYPSASAISNNNNNADMMDEEITLMQADTLTLQLSVKSVNIWIQIPHNYPFAPPTIHRVTAVNNNHKSSLASSVLPSKAALYCKEWSPMKQLVDFIHFLIQVVQEDARSSSGSHYFDPTTAFPPNRFHVGYDTTSSNSHSFYPYYIPESSRSRKHHCSPFEQKQQQHHHHEQQQQMMDLSM